MAAKVSLPLLLLIGGTHAAAPPTAAPTAAPTSAVTSEAEEVDEDYTVECDTDTENKCTEDGVEYCWPSSMGDCPVFCTDSQVECYNMPYTSDGEIDWDNMEDATITCHAENYTCPCNSEWEETCTFESETFCYPKDMGCPLDCGDKDFCFTIEYNTDGSFKEDDEGELQFTETCATSYDGCGCNAVHELNCTNDWGEVECMPKAFMDECPMVCTEEQTTCYQVEFTPDFDFVAVCKDTEEECFGLCGTGALKCGTGEEAYCIPDTDSCPLECAANEEMCYVDNFDTSGGYVSTTEKCAAEGATCPCGDNALSTPCTFYDPFFDETISWCVPSTETCPVECNMETEQLCYDVGFTADGFEDWDTANETCKPMSETCGCNGANSRQCTVSWFGMNETFCQAASIDGFDNPCPVSCDEDEEICFTMNYDASGFVTGFTEKCVAPGASCGCGTNSRTCKDEWGSYCIPKVDSDTRLPLTCPIVCDESVNTFCVIPSFTGSGEFTSFKEECVSGVDQTCDCSKGTNTKSCTFTFFGESWTECIPKSEYCPIACTGDNVSCPEVLNFAGDGSVLSLAAPKADKACAADYDKCPCGKGAKKCVDQEYGYSWCQPTKFPCPVYCKQGEKACWVQNYNTTTGVLLNEQERCVKQNDPCPCGKGSKRCPATGECIAEVDMSIICPCKASEKQCMIEDFSKLGKMEGLRSKCVTKGSKCPCGKNTQTCEDKLDKGNTMCLPKTSKDGKQGCPKPCSPGQELEGNVTCVRTNLDQKGNFLSEAITCVADLSNCKPGAGMMKCPTNATVKLGAKCSDPYGLLKKKKSARRLAAVGAGEKLTSKISFFLKGVNKTQKEISGVSMSVKASLDSVLMLMSPLSSTLTVTKTANTMTASAIYVVSNSGISKVSPAQIATNLKTKISTGDKTLAKAFVKMGKVDKTKGATISSTTKTVAVRGETPVPTPAPPVVTPAPTPKPPAPTPRPTPAPAPPVTGSTTEITFSLAIETNATCGDVTTGSNMHKAVVQAGAAMAGVDKTKVAVTCKAARRLDEFLETAAPRRLAALTFDYVVTVPTAEATAAQASLNSVTASSAAAAFSQAVADNGVAFSMSVTEASLASMKASIASKVVSSDSNSTATTTTGEGPGGGESLATCSSVPSLVSAVLVVLTAALSAN
eukprot:TRINITY_DN101906_c0_g1_i1.p1 TRINITY_DN101906_c0_g1~~TRINITY_DN101906_c0_g1_i1.p1  ORF type:complete len:1191 (-),score=305.33 TRINITY_DN101906_c0_g1_i1:147-3632(-)